MRARLSYVPDSLSSLSLSPFRARWESCLFRELHHREHSVSSSPASYGSRGWGPKSGRKTIPLEWAGRDLLPERCDPAWTCWGRQARVGRATTWGWWRLNREARSSGEKDTAGRLACSRWDHCLPPNHGYGSGAGPDWERRDPAYRTASS